MSLASSLAGTRHLRCPDTGDTRSCPDTSDTLLAILTPATPAPLRQGLRIAPPEAPATGYMFGKGIYFADMVSKSANYCFASHSNPRGLLLLCEVALGNM